MLRRQQNPLSDESTFSFHTTEKSHLIYRTSFASRDLRLCSRGGGGGVTRYLDALSVTWSFFPESRMPLVSHLFLSLGVPCRPLPVSYLRVVTCHHRCPQSLPFSSIFTHPWKSLLLLLLSQVFCIPGTILGSRNTVKFGTC